jgi:hypothetical protein
VTAVGRRGRDTATVVITVAVGTINLAFEKHATQSSNYNKTNYHFFGIRRNMKVLLIGVGTEVCFIRNAR